VWERRGKISARWVASKCEEGREGKTSKTAAPVFIHVSVYRASCRALIGFGVSSVAECMYLGFSTSKAAHLWF